MWIFSWWLVDELDELHTVVEVEDDEFLKAMIMRSCTAVIIMLLLVLGHHDKTREVLGQLDEQLLLALFRFLEVEVDDLRKDVLVVVMEVLDEVEQTLLVETYDEVLECLDTDTMVVLLILQ